MSHFNGTVKDIILNNIAEKKFTGYGSVLENTKKLRSLVEVLDFEELRKCMVH